MTLKLVEHRVEAAEAKIPVREAGKMTSIARWFPFPRYLFASITAALDLPELTKARQRGEDHEVERMEKTIQEFRNSLVNSKEVASRCMEKAKLFQQMYVLSSDTSLSTCPLRLEAF